MQISGCTCGFNVINCAGNKHCFCIKRMKEVQNLMKKIRLGKTGLMVTKTAFGCLPIQRCSESDAVSILRRAYDGGINFFDTANAYTDSEYKLGLALSDVRSNIVISTKSRCTDYRGTMAHIENSLRTMKTDYIDIFQFHVPSAMPDPNDPNGAFKAAYEAKEKGYVRHIGVTAHSLDLAFQELESGLFETIQYPFSYLSTDREQLLVKKCEKADVGFIAMKGLAGGLLTNARACHAFMKNWENAANIWGIQKMEELEQWLALAQEDPSLDDELQKVIDADREQLTGGFCRSCGYCMPCPAGIELNQCMRMNMLLRRSPWREYYTDEWRAKMEKIKDCIGCGQCMKKCPYGLKCPDVLKYMYEDYINYFEEHKDEF